MSKNYYTKIKKTHVKTRTAMQSVCMCMYYSRSDTDQLITGSKLIQFLLQLLQLLRNNSTLVPRLLQQRLQPSSFTIA